MTRIGAYIRHLRNYFRLMRMKPPVVVESTRIWRPYSAEAPTLANCTEEEHRAAVFMCDGKKRQGGLTDRLNGLLTTYFLAKKAGKPFRIYWREPFRLEDYLLPNKVDWRIEGDNLSHNLREAYPVVVSYKYGKPGCRLRHLLEQRALGALMRRKRQLHVYTNYAGDYDYGQLFFELFRPSPEIQERLRPYEGRKYAAFSFRFQQLLGDFTDTWGDVLPEEQRGALIEKNLSELLKMAEQLPVGTDAFVATDSETFLERVAAARHPKIFVVEGDIRHTDLMTSAEADHETVMKTFVDLYLLMRAQRIYRMKTGKMRLSGFPLFASRLTHVPFEEHSF